MRAHATEADLATWLGGAVPDQAGRLLLRASEVIDRYVVVPYYTDTNGNAADTTVAGVLRDATCAQVEFWQEVDEAHDIDGIGGQISTSGVNYSLPMRIGQRARDILRANGFLNTSGVGV